MKNLEEGLIIKRKELPRKKTRRRCLKIFRMHFEYYRVSKRESSI